MSASEALIIIALAVVVIWAASGCAVHAQGATTPTPIAPPVLTWPSADPAPGSVQAFVACTVTLATVLPPSEAAKKCQKVTKEADKARQPRVIVSGYGYGNRVVVPTRSYRPIVTPRVTIPTPRATTTPQLTQARGGYWGGSPATGR